eukprot:CAMPEP_0113963300 /NCGR_PEP_ID=MMETSP0011_2-20120614/6430_1 /TAXON_ID=101924 /ORGANISM="Rhodosorus marinus" /LENGTH=338 /DNA_ID=CAMNT_0000975321 /DNA_START=12 /DNA_END=1028 /DNA_ORIENTATION=+ /assembly_acc=CAM_ASM_000156
MEATLENETVKSLEESMGELHVDAVKKLPPPDPAEFKLKYEVKIKMSTFGEHLAKDLFLIGHNALRWELMDLQRVMLRFFNERFQVGKTDVEQLLGWLEVFFELVGEYFDYEETLLFPWISTRIVLNFGEHGIHLRLRMKAKLLLVMRACEDYYSRFLYTAPGELLPEFCEVLRFLTEALLEYIDFEQKGVMTFVASKMDEKDTFEFYDRMQKLIVASDYPLQLFIFFTRHIKMSDYFPAFIRACEENPKEHQEAWTHFNQINSMLSESTQKVAPELPEDLPQVTKSAKRLSNPLAFLRGSKDEDSEKRKMRRSSGSASGKSNGVKGWRRSVSKKSAV